MNGSQNKIIFHNKSYIITYSFTNLNTTRGYNIIDLYYKFIKIFK